MVNPSQHKPDKKSQVASNIINQNEAAFYD